VLGFVVVWVEVRREIAERIQFKKRIREG